MKRTTRYNVARVLCAGLMIGAAFLSLRRQKTGSWITFHQSISDVASFERKGMVYSNLVDAKTQKEAAQMMQEAGIKAAAVDLLFDWVNDYNNRVESGVRLKSGFWPMADSMQVDYSNVFLESRYLDNDEIQMDPNCRIISFLLMNSMISSEAVFKEEDPYLMFDVYAIETDPVFQSLTDQVDAYITLFQPIEVGADTGYEEHKKLILKEWERRNITIQKSDTLSLITLFLHDPYENKRFVGHSGIEIEMNGAVWFVEKYASGLPYQLTRFTSKEELSEYLLGRMNLYGDGTEESPIILENEHLLLQ